MTIKEIRTHLLSAETFWNETPSGKIEDRTIAEILDILEDILDHLETVNRATYHANNTASCLANGILPD